MKRTIVASTKEFEIWLSGQTRMVRPDLAYKHDQMAISAFAFLRATFYRWSERWPHGCPDAARTPTVLSVGDLHVENFGTWRDSEGRLIWGINDHDEAWPLPYLNDLIRLATSVHVARKEGQLRIKASDACGILLDGYKEGLRSGGQPFVLDQNHRVLRFLALNDLKDPQRFWPKLCAQSPLRGELPESAAEALRSMLPEAGLHCTLKRRRSGLGSLGRERFLALADWRGGMIAREAKALVPSAVAWATGAAPQTYTDRLLQASSRVPDPFLRIRDKWIVRRLAPDCSRIELAKLPPCDEERVLHAMGFETANLHLFSSPAINAVQRDLSRRTARWFHAQVKKMSAEVIEDWKDWRRR